MGGRAFASFGIVACIAAHSNHASADLDFQLSAGAGVSWRRSMPRLTSESVSTAARDLPESKVAIGGSVLSLGAGFDSSAIVDDHWIVPAIGLAGYGAIGSYDTVVTSIDGSIARIRPWTTYEIDVLLPGIGYRLKKRRFMFSASLRTGVAALSVDGTVAGGASENVFKATGLSVLAMMEIEACRRLDPMTRLCLQVVPRIYDFGFMNGATFGLRFEWGR